MEGADQHKGDGYHAQAGDGIHHQERVGLADDAGQGLDVVEKVVDLLGDSLGWDAQTRDRQVRKYRVHIRAARPGLLDLL